jgi:hypothetical protein
LSTRNSHSAAPAQTRPSEQKPRHTPAASPHSSAADADSGVSESRAKPKAPESFAVPGEAQPISDPGLAAAWSDPLEDRAAFARFVGQLLENRRAHPEEWEHRSLMDFLEALQIEALNAATQYAADQAPDNLQAPKASWRHFADLLLQARGGQ